MFFIPIPFLFNNLDKPDNTSKDRVNKFKALHDCGYVDDMIQKHTRMIIEAAQCPLREENITDEEYKQILRKHKDEADNIMKQIKSEKKDVYGF